MLVDQIIDLLDFSIINTSSWWECNHNASKIFAVSFDFSFKIVKINLSFRDIDWDHFQSNQNSTCWISSMCSCWNQTNVSVTLADTFEISLDGFEASVLTGGTAVWLERDIVKLSDFLEPVFQLFDHCKVAFSLLFRNKWMNVKLRPAHWNHLTCCIQFHSTATQCIHGSC